MATGVTYILWSSSRGRFFPETYLIVVVSKLTMSMFASPAIYNGLNRDKHPSQGKKHGGAPAPLLPFQGRPLLKGGSNHSPFDFHEAVSFQKQNHKLTHYMIYPSLPVPLSVANQPAGTVECRD